MRRTSPAAVAIALLQALAGLLAVTLLWSTAGRRLDGWLGTLVDVVFWVYVVLRLGAVPLGWLSTRWAVTQQGVRVRRGVLLREETDVRWAEVVSVDVSQPSLHRLFGCYGVRFGLGTSQKAAVQLDAVSRRTRDEVVAVAAAAQREAPPAPAAPAPPLTAPVAPDASPAGHEVYRIRRRDHVLVSLSYGSFVLFVPAVLSLLDQVGGWVPLHLPRLTVVLGWSPATQLAAAVGVLVLSLGYGWLFTWLRYGGFRVLHTAAGFRTSGGLLSRQTRTVRADQVTGLKITQNPVMRLSGRGRVSVVTRDAGDQPMANLLFPLVRLADLPAALGPVMAVHPEVVRPTQRLGGLARTLLVTGAVLGWAGLLGLAWLLRPGWFVASATTVTVVVVLLTNAAWVVAGVRRDHPVCSVRRGFAWVSQVEFATSTIRVVESSQGVLGRLSGTWTVVLHHHDGRVRRVRALGCSAQRRRELTAPVLQRPSAG